MIEHEFKPNPWGHDRCDAKGDEGDGRLRLCDRPRSEHDWRAAAGIPRRCCIDLFTPAEKAIYDAVAVVEAAGAHQRLTDAVNLLGKARDAVADFVDGRQGSNA